MLEIYQQKTLVFFKVKGSAKKRCREMHLFDFKADCYFILLVKGLIKGF